MINKQTGLYVGVHRVWLRNQDFPGLAMSRSIGDKLAHTVGVIPDPGNHHSHLTFAILDFFHMKLFKDEYDYCIVSASDGIWDVLNI
jgi:hypothetical protein